MPPLKIAGAGPAGLAAAITLARSGVEVEVHERRADVGSRFHGDYQGLENWSRHADVLDELRSLGIETDFEHFGFRKTVVTDTVRIKDSYLPRPSYYVLRRGPFPGSLDRALRAQAEALDVPILWDSPLGEDEADIVATGVQSHRVYGVARGQVFDTDAPDNTVLAFSDEIAHKAYAYLLVAGGRGCMCSMVCDDLPRANACFERARAFFLDHWPMEMRNVRDVGGIGSFSLEPRWQVGPRLYVGEAAGLQDLLWGFGMRYALVSGVLAARSVVDGGDYPDRARDRFDQVLRSGIVNRYLWERVLGRTGYWPLVRHSRLCELFIRSFHSFNPLQRLLHRRALAYVRNVYPQVG